MTPSARARRAVEVSDLAGLVVYVLTLKSWAGYDPLASHTYGRIHWTTPDTGQRSADSVALPDAEGFCTSRHPTRDSAIDGARRWFADHGQPGSALVIGDWTLCGFDEDEAFEVLEKKPAMVAKRTRNT